MTLKFDDEKLRKPADPRRVPYITRMIKLEYQLPAAASYDLPGPHPSAASGTRRGVRLTRRRNGQKTPR